MQTTTTTKANMHLLTEDLCTISQAAKMLPRNPHISTVARWVDRGVGGVKLESLKIGRERLTSTQAITRFIAACNSGK